ncbi:MAG: tRNA (adenosine(37)-N6)-dimethylallyltransferase MiaA [Bacteroidetes bacterium]|nr:tRNA (adenosine(37)-N6)-dimethylallyltransferase MiaA [Bacteroidota bacterium]MCW5897268.1 tRNA (adenosine(37)-N6)-dimethylallyltransferase MiaA [Bacteroidota bacterium]
MEPVTFATKRKVPVLVGPTASGKTDVAMELAKRTDGEILSADSRQIYKHLTIGTAKPSALRLSSVKHHFVDILTPDQEFSAGEFGEKGRIIIDEIFSRNKMPVVVGGSGLYIQSLIDGFFEGPGADKDFRKILDQRVASGELRVLIEELRRVDPVSAERIDPTKPRRIVRALEVFHITGKALSQLHQEFRIEIRFTPLLFGLEWERTKLYDRINRRCEAMLDEGLLKEIDLLERCGYSSSFNALNTVGYAEAFAYRRGDISYDEMLRLFKQNSRRYAKRQLTWFRRDARIKWLKCDETTDYGQLADTIYQQLLGQRGE